MSQVIKNLASGPVPPSVATSYTTDAGTAVPSGNVLDVRAVDNTTSTTATFNNEPNGIITLGGLTNTGASNRIDVQLTNRYHASGSTVGAVTTTIMTIPLGAAVGNYAFEFYGSGFESTGPSGTAYNILSCIRSSGAAATLVGTSDETYVEDAALGASDLQVTVSGNNVLVQAVGIGGLTIDWNIIANFVFIG